MDVLQDHAFEALEVVESEVVGGPDGIEEGGAGVVADHAEKPPDGKDSASAGVALKVLDVGGGLGCFGKELAFLGAGFVLGRSGAARGPVFGEGAAAGPPDDAPVGGDEARAEEELDVVLGLADFELSTDEGGGSGVVASADVDVALEVDDAVVEVVDLGKPSGERSFLEARSLELNFALMVSHHSRACRFASLKSAKWRPTRKFLWMYWKWTSTWAERLTSPFS
jgi:hypothetical protein